MSVKHSLRIISLLWLVSASGCTHFQEWRANGKVGPNHRPPTANVACEWQQYNSPYVIGTQNAVVDDSWWEVFNDAEILRFVSTANSGYLPLKSAMLRVQEQCFIRNIAVGNLFPQEQEAFGRYNRIQFGENGNQVGIPGLGQSFDLWEMGFNASWEIDVWGRLRRLVESSTAEVQASVEDVHDVRLSLTADVVSTYTLIRVLQQRIQIARDQVEAQEKTLRIAEARLKNGSATKLDVTQATAIAESTRATIPQLESELRQANNQLCLLLGVPTQVLFDDKNIGEIPSTPEQVVVGLPRDLLRRRPDIRRAERKIASQSAQIGVAAAELFPTFALRGTINWQSFKLSRLFESAANAGAIAPGFRWNLLNYGRLKNRVCVERTRLEQAIVGYRQTVLNANAEVEDALTVFVKKKEEIVAIQRAVEATRESLEIATTQYREGSVDLDRVNNLRKDLIRQLDLETAAQGQAAIALIRVYKTMGGGWLPGSGNVISSQPAVPTEATVPEPTVEAPVNEVDAEANDSGEEGNGADASNSEADWEPTEPTPPDTGLNGPVREILDSARRPSERTPYSSNTPSYSNKSYSSNTAGVPSKVAFLPIQREPLFNSGQGTVATPPAIERQLRVAPMNNAAALPRPNANATVMKLSNVPEARSFPIRTPMQPFSSPTNAIPSTLSSEPQPIPMQMPSPPSTYGAGAMSSLPAISPSQLYQPNQQSPTGEMMGRSAAPLSVLPYSSTLSR